MMKSNIKKNDAPNRQGNDAFSDAGMSNYRQQDALQGNRHRCNVNLKG